MNKCWIAFLLFFFLSAPAAEAQFLEPEKYPDTSTYLCRSNPIEVHSGQNLNLLALTSTCPRAEKLSGPGPDAPTGTGYITSFRPDLVELLARGKQKTPRVDDLHLHHVVWLRDMSQPSFAAGEEKTYVSFPRGYGLRSRGDARWGINYMIHNLWPRDGRQVEIQWKIDWVPENGEMQDVQIRWMDVAGDNLYPVFDAERKYDIDRDGIFLFPDDAAQPLHEEYSKISRKQRWEITTPTTLLFTAGHLHPGGLFTDLRVQRGDRSRTIFRSAARYYGPAGAASWDVSLQATRRDWKVALRPGDVVTLHAAYDVRRASWYEAMGIMPLAHTNGWRAGARDPFDADLPTGGVLTHGRLPENIDDRANRKLGLRDPRKLPNRKKYVRNIRTSSYLFFPGGYSATRNFPAFLQRPALVRSSAMPTFWNADAREDMAQEEQIWHTITSCRPPCNRSSGISYPLADGRFDSGQLGHGIDDISGLLSDPYGYWNETVTTGSSSWQAPRMKRGLYTYFCRIHPFMRGSLRVR